MSKRLLQLSVVLVIFSTSAAFLFFSPSGKTKKLPLQAKTSKQAATLTIEDYPEYLKIQKQNWIAEIKQNPQNAYDNFKQTSSEADTDIQHALSHEFGALLFLLKGDGGIEYCDGSFDYGCYHGFFGQAVEVQGLKNITSLDTACSRIKNSINCQHGLGHAILGYYKTNDHIKDALAVCQKLKNYGPYGGCINGVFMEYNFSNLRTPPARPRTLTNDNVNTPCLDIPKAFRESCYFIQVQWWKQAISSSSSDYTKIGKLCSELGEERLKRSCFIGTGNLIGVRTHFDVKEAIDACDQMPTNHGKVYCRTGIMWMFLADLKHKENAEAACNGLNTRELQICKASGSF